MKAYIFGGLAALGAALAAAPALAQTFADGRVGDPAHGKTLYNACMSCHSIDENDIGPKHRGVVGRRSGSIPDYAYSAAVKALGVTWTPANLDRWLTDPQAMAPGAKMFFSVPSAQNRADIIAYLATQR